MKMFFVLTTFWISLEAASYTKKVYPISRKTSNVSSSSSGNDTVSLNGMTLERFCASFGANLPKGGCTCRTFSRVCEILDILDKNKKVKAVTCSDKSLVKAVLATCLCTVGLIANLIVVLLAKRNWNNSVYCHKLIGGLALADLLFLVFSLMQYVPLIWSCQWIYSVGMCKFLFPAINMTATTGLGFVLIISIERYIGITHPFSRGMTSKAIYIIVSVNLLISIASVLPASVVLNYDESKQSCSEQWLHPDHSRIYTWVLFATSFACPVIIISALYLSMLHQLRRSTTKSLRNMNTCDRVLGKRKRENKRVAVIVVSLVISFVLFVSPNRIYWILNDEGFFKHYDRSFQTLVLFASDVSYIFHAVINPIIYSIIDVKFRSSLKHFFCSSSSRRRSRSQYSSNVLSSYMKESTRVTTNTSFSNLSSNRSSTSDRRKMEDL